MWQGTKEDVKEVVDVIENFRAKEVERLQQNLNEAQAAREREIQENVDRVKSWLVPSDRVTFRDDISRQAFESALYRVLEDSASLSSGYAIKDAEAAIHAISVHVSNSLTDGSGIEDTPSVVLPMMEPGKVKTLEIKMGNTVTNPQLLVAFDRYKGAQITAASSDPTWVVGALTQLRALLSQRRPWYAFLASPFVSMPVCLVLAFLGAVNISEWFNIPPNASNYWFTAIFGGGAGLWILWTMFLFPRFELYKSGGKPAAKALTGAVLAAASIPWTSIFS